jgi:hypothetical protein
VSPNLVDAGHHRRIERRRDITGAAGTMRAVAMAAARVAAREAASLQQQSNVRKRRQKAASIPVQYLLLPIGPEVTAFTPQPLISSTLGSICLIRESRTDEVRVHGRPVPYWGSRYGTDGLSEIPAPDSPLSRITRKFGLVLRSHRFCLCVT